MDASEYKHVVLGDNTLKDIARELVKSVRAKLRVMVRRILRKYG